MDMESGELGFAVGERITISYISDGDDYFFLTGASGLVKDVKGETALVKFDSGEFNKTSGGEWWVGIDNISIANDVTLKLLDDVVYFAKVNQDAIIPTKRDEDAGYDIYPLFEENHIKINPHETILIPTGIASAFDMKYRFELWERGSTGTKGIGQRCGVIDSGFRGEWKVPVTNHNEIPLVIVKDEDEFYESYAEGAHIMYPYSKAICQALLDVVPKVEIQVKEYEELLKIESKRGVGMVGSSGK